MAELHPLLAGFLAAVALMSAVWLLSLVRRDVSVVDIFWGFSFVLVAWTYAAWTSGFPSRGMLVLAMVTLWGLRLSWHLWRRNWNAEEDYRYREMREAAGPSFAYRSLVTVFWLQAALAWIISLPLFAAQASAVPANWTTWDGAGLALFAVGFLFEAVGDAQLARFKADPANRGQVLDTGLWRYTRHPNYFGDALLWWGMSLPALATPGSWWVLLGPVLMSFLLMRVSGVTLLEKRLKDTKPRYREYVRRTNAFFPWLPKSQ